MSKKHRPPVFQVLESGDGGADVSGVTATAPDVDEGKVFVDNTGEQVVGTSTYKADYIALSDNIDELNEDLEEVITGDGTGGGLTVDSVKGLIDGTGTTFTIPYGTTKINKSRFSNMSNLKTVDIPNTVTEIGENAFYFCDLRNLTALPNSITTIGNSAFAFTNVTLNSLPSSLTSLGSNVFTSDQRLTSITFLGTPTTIHSNAFNGCSYLTTIRVPWQEGEVANAPWGAVNSSIIYGYTPS